MLNIKLLLKLFSWIINNLAQLTRKLVTWQEILELYLIIGYFINSDTSRFSQKFSQISKISMKFCIIIEIICLIVAVQGLHRIEHVLQAAFTSLELQSARCPLNFDILTLKKSCSICDQIHGTTHFQPLKIKAACSTLIRYRCCEPNF